MTEGQFRNYVAYVKLQYNPWLCIDARGRIFWSRRDWLHALEWDGRVVYALWHRVDNDSETTWSQYKEEYGFNAIEEFERAFGYDYSREMGLEILLERQQPHRHDPDFSTPLDG